MIIKHNINILIFAMIYIIFSIYGFYNTESSDNKIHITNHFLYYFENNMTFCLIISSGVFFFGLSTFLFLCPNAYLLGSTIKSSVIDGFSSVEIIYNLLHGLLEIPGIYFFFCIGFLPIQESFNFLFEKNYEFLIRDIMISIIKNFTIGSTLIFIGAIIESLL